MLDLEQASLYFTEKSPCFIQQENGKQIQNSTIFGLILQYSTMDKEFQWNLNHITSNSKKEFNESQKKQIVQLGKVLKDRIYEIIGQLYCIVKKMFDQSEQIASNILKWANLILKLNQNKLKTYQSIQNQESLSSDGFLLNFQKLILMMCKHSLYDFNKLDQIQEQIIIDEFINYDQGFYQTLPKLTNVEFANFDLTLEQNNNNTINPNAQQRIMKDPIKIKKIQTQLFIIAHQAVHITVPILQNAISKQLEKKEENIQREVQDYENFLETVMLMQLNSQINNSKEKQFIEIQALLSSYLDFNQFQEVLNLYSLFTQIIFKINNVNYSNILGAKEVGQPSPIYCQLPQSIAEDLMGLLMFMLLNFKEYPQHFKGQLNLITSLVSIWINNETWLNNPHIRQKLISLISIILEIDKEQNLQIFQFTENNSILQFHILPGIMKIDNLTKKESINDKDEQVTMRKHFIKISNIVMPQKSFQIALNNFVENNFSIFFHFISNYFEDFKQLIKELFDISQQDLGLNDIFQQQLELLQEENSVDLINLIFGQLNSNKSQTLNAYINQYSNNFYLMMTENKDLMLKHELLDKTVECLLYLITYASKQFKSQQKNQDPQSQQNQSDSERTINLRDQYEPKSLTDSSNKDIEQDVQNEYPLILLKYCYEIFFLYADNNSEFIDLLTKDCNFDLYHFKECFNLIPQSNEQTSKMNNYFQQIKQAVGENEFMDYIIQHCPSQYIDPLVYQIMQEPVKLPKSNNIVDKSTILKHLLSDNSDPFTRDALEECQLIELPELKKEIQQYIKQERFKYKENQQQNQQNTPKLKGKEDQQQQQQGDPTQNSIKINNQN